MQPSFPHVEGITHRFVKVNGMHLHLAEAGSGEPMLMLHGWPQHWYMWRYQIPYFAQHFTVICPDLRGFGWSDAPATGYEKERLVDDIISLLDRLNLKRIRLVAHDWGGWVGFLLCLRQPEGVQCYVALNIPHPFQTLDSRVFLLWRFWYQWVIASPLLGKWIIQNQSGFVRRLLRWGVVNKTWTDEEIAIYTSRLREPARAYASVLLYRSFLLREFIPIVRGRYRSSHLSTPSLILFGLRDFALAPDLLKGYESYADDLKVELVPNSGHFIAEDQPEFVTKRALDFFVANDSPFR
jgi:pimeloyl-ACP methyl ester carboxylesterase